MNQQAEDSNSLPSGQKSDNSSEWSKSESRIDEDQNSEDDVSEINADSPQRVSYFIKKEGTLLNFDWCIKFSI